MKISKAEGNIPKIGFGIYGQNEFKLQIESLFIKLGAKIFTSIGNDFSIKENYAYTISDDGFLLESNVVASNCHQYFFDDRDGKLYELYISNLYSYQQFVYLAKNLLPGEKVRVKEFNITAIITGIRDMGLGFKYILDNDNSILWDFEEIEKL